MAHTKDFLIGAAVGSLVGTVSTLLLAPKSGKELRGDISDMYCDASDKTKCYTKKGKDFIKNVKYGTNNLTDKAKCIVNDIVDWVNPSDDESSNSNLLIGGLVGSVVGVIAGLMLAPKAGSELRDDISDMAHEKVNLLSKKGQKMAKNMNSKANEWLELAQDVVDALTDKVKETSEDLTEKADDFLNHSRVKNIMELVSLGARMWKQAKKRG